VVDEIAVVELVARRGEDPREGEDLGAFHVPDFGMT